MTQELTDELRSFIDLHREMNASDLALKLSKSKDLPKQFILDQINGLQKAKKKFPFLLDHKNFIYPSSRSVAQSSSEYTAKYKADLFNNLDSTADLSGGMGIDTYFFSLNSKQVDHVEIDQTLSDIVRKNFRTLERSNIQCYPLSAEEYLSKQEKKHDLIYLDPDRRKEDKRLFLIKDCSPDLSQIQERLINCSKKVLVKYSPMLDITAALKELNKVEEVHVISVKNELKELLFLLDKEARNPIIKCVELQQNNLSSFEFRQEEEIHSEIEYGELGEYLYEPKAAILKAGAFKTVGARFNLIKLAKNTHLYTSDHPNPDFPGRILKVISVNKNPSKDIKMANIVSRNSGLSVDQIKKKYKIKEGGNLFLYAFQDREMKRQFALCEQL